MFKYLADILSIMPHGMAPALFVIFILFAHLHATLNTPQKLFGNTNQVG